MRYITIVFAFCILGIWLFNVKTLREVTSLEKELKIANEKDMEDAGSLVSVTLLLLMAKYGTTIGPSFPKIIS